MKPETPRIHMPRTAQAGEIIRILTKVRHPMETGWRRGGDGKKVPRNRINKFVCDFNGKEVFSADFHSGVSADPYLVFHAKVSGTGTYNFKWEADDGKVFTASAPITTVGV